MVCAAVILLLCASCECGRGALGETAGLYGLTEEIWIISVGKNSRLLKMDVPRSRSPQVRLTNPFMSSSETKSLSCTNMNLWGMSANMLSFI